MDEVSLKNILIENPEEQGTPRVASTNWREKKDRKAENRRGRIKEEKSELAFKKDSASARHHGGTRP